jgi:hypothetical protein
MKGKLPPLSLNLFPNFFNILWPLRKVARSFAAAGENGSFYNKFPQ